MESKNIKKVIIIGDKTKVSSEMIENIKKHYGCEIEIISREEYANSDLSLMSDPSIALEHLFEMREPVLPEIEILDPKWKDKKLHAPYNSKNIGKVHTKMPVYQKKYNCRKRGR